jgi:hypothetical protein
MRPGKGHKPTYLINIARFPRHSRPTHTGIFEKVNQTSDSKFRFAQSQSISLAVRVKFVVICSKSVLVNGSWDEKVFHEMYYLRKSTSGLTNTDFKAYPRLIVLVLPSVSNF